MELAQLKQQGYVWQWQPQSAAAASQAATLTSGYPELDQLTGGGWPQHQVTELRSPFGIGELRLLLPYLQQQQAGKLQVYLNAPAPLHAPFLAANGFTLAQQLQIQSKPEQALWAAEQCLKSGCCSSVLLWQSELSIARLKRLQLAAAEGQAELFLFRPPHPDQLSLPVALSLQLQPSAQGIQARLLKKRGGWPGAEQDICFSTRWPKLVHATPSAAEQPASRRALG